MSPSLDSVFVLIIFIVLFALILLAVTLGLKYFETERRRKVESALKTVVGLPDAPQARILSDQDASRAARALSDLPIARTMDSRLQQAGLEWTVEKLLTFMAVGGVVGFLTSFLFVRVPVFREAALAGCTALGAALPYMYVLRARSKRLRAFESQFPEALDFLARSLRAGHAFSVSLEMMADESPDPLGPEFRRLFNEQNLGAAIDVALRNFAGRVPLLDVRFFVSAVLLQRETGGNLAEILNKLSYVIRERFRLKGQIRAVSAHGRLTAGVLTILPVVTIFGLMVLNPGYIEYMAGDKTGRKLIILGIFLQTSGYYVMKRIVNIKV